MCRITDNNSIIRYILNNNTSSADKRIFSNLYSSRNNSSYSKRCIIFDNRSFKREGMRKRFKSCRKLVVSKGNSWPNKNIISYMCFFRNRNTILNSAVISNNSLWLNLDIASYLRVFSNPASIEIAKMSNTRAPPPPPLHSSQESNSRLRHLLQIQLFL